MDTRRNEVRTARPSLHATYADLDKAYEEGLRRQRKQLPICGATCLICNQYHEVFTHAHAQKHGYKSKGAMFKDGKVKFMNPTEQKRYQKLYGREEPT